MTMERRNRTTGPGWTGPLRPDELTRARLRRAILDEAGPLLAARRASWWEVAAGWASLLTPAAAAAALLLFGVGLRGTGPEAPPRIVAEAGDMFDVVSWVSSAEVPAALTRDTLADLDLVFAAIHEGP
ncbi:MAG: hypothetical protein RRA92_09060 [Gemmatimonadota bacterium]|nr:hypothetical protein [Gemmatimonadota bacterium]